jgi:TPP-dependent pyruvate/acetoin dehydrogenase alpha subunit
VTTTSQPAGLDLSALHLTDRHHTLGLGDDEVLAMFRTIVLARVLDQKIWGLNRMGKAAFVVSAQGHEGAQIGSAWAFRRGPGGPLGAPGVPAGAGPEASAPARDWTLPYYRDLGVMLTLGMSPYEVLLGVFARAADPSSGGRQMPNHWGSAAMRVISGSSPIATHLPHAAGVAWAVKARSGDDVVFCLFGDGAASKGDFHEALNFAGIHRLPIVFLCENNG